MDQVANCESVTGCKVYWGNLGLGIGGNLGRGGNLGHPSPA